MTSLTLMRKFRTLFFDLDGTLLDISDEEFERSYSLEAYKHFKDKIDLESFLSHLITGTALMIKHTSNEPVVNSFFNYFAPKVNLSVEEAIQRFVDFYETNFDKLQESCRKIDIVPKLIIIAKELGYKLVLATQPLFYELATRKRVQWAGLNPEDFLYIPHALNSSRCKPSPEYFTTLLSKAGSKPEETLMVGNDYLYDMSAKLTGITTYLIDKNTAGLEYKEKFPPDYHGTFVQLLEFIQDK